LQFKKKCVSVSIWACQSLMLPSVTIVFETWSRQFRKVRRTWVCLWISLVQVMQHNISSPSKSIRRTLLRHVMCSVISLSHVYWVEMTTQPTSGSAAAEHNGARQMSALKVYSSKFRASLFAIFSLNLLIVSSLSFFRVYLCTRQLLILYFTLKGRKKSGFQDLRQRMIITVIITET